MPYFKLDTNVSKDKITADFLKSTSKMISDTLGKPENVSSHLWYVISNLTA